MRKFALTMGAVVLFLLVLPSGFAAKKPTSAKENSGTIVIIFKDGHRQVYNLADIAHVEYTGATEAAAAVNPEWPARGRFVGRWVVGIGTGNDDTFTITLKEDGSAMRSLHEIHGTWAYVNGEARISWDDGAQDAIRKVGTQFEKYAYHAGKSFTDEPDNVTSAHNTTPKPI